MQRLLFRISVAALCVAGIPCRSIFAGKPNVIVIMSDDQGIGDVGCYGSPDVLTPAIDSLAACGIRFTQFYSAAPVCSPSRAGLLTGRFPLRAGLTGNASSQPGGKSALPPEQITMAEMFRAAGYRTAHIGKWHLGYTPETSPLAQGFDQSFGHMGGCIDNYSHFFYWSGPNRHDLYRNGKEVYHDGQFFGDLMVDEASRFIEENTDQPFFMYFAINMPHYPYQGDEKWLTHYANLPYPRNLYAAFMSTCDERIGRLIQCLEARGLKEDTIIVFQSDNGHSTEERAHYGGGSAGPFRGQKFSLFEGGMRLPGIISWPAKIPAGETRHQLVHSVDWMPTLAELCGVELPKRALDGRSLTAVIRSSTAPSPHSVLHWYVGGGKNAQWAVRQGDWKLIGNVQSAPDESLTIEDRKLFLSNLATDSAETTNHANQHPELVERLHGLHKTWLQQNSQADLPPATTRDSKGNEQ
ncbi:MAG: sulfatase-like hydrolase/transferase [Planctomycetaceae bacterium]